VVFINDDGAVGLFPAGGLPTQEAGTPGPTGTSADQQRATTPDPTDEGRSQRPVPLRQRQEIPEVLREELTARLVVGRVLA
jgi:hypothetical protein